MLRVVLVLLGVVVVAVLRVLVEEEGGGGEARLGAPLFFLLGVTADHFIFLAQTRRARGGL